MQITVKIVAIETITYIIGYFDIFRHMIRQKHLNKVECQVFQNIYVCIDTYAQICMHIYTHMHRQTHTYVHVYTQTSTHIHACTYIEI